MGTQRYISTSFWDDEWIQTLDPSEKLLYLYFMTNPLTNIAGIYKVTERRVSFDTGFTQSTVQHIMEKFGKAGKAIRFGEWIILPTWTKHQKVSERDNNRKGIDTILKALPEDVFVFAVEKGYKYIYINNLGRGLQGCSTTSNYSNINLNLESNLNLEVKEEVKPTRTTFQKPTPEQVVAYCTSRRNSVDCEKWLDHYESNGWMVGKTKMKDWQASIRTWERNEYGGSKPTQSKPIIKKGCPSCGGEIFNSTCRKCGVLLDAKGEILV